MDFRSGDKLWKAVDWMGDLASGIVVNYGKAGDFMGLAASGKIIAIKNPKSFGYLKDAELVLIEEECRRIPWLIEYFDELKNKIYEGRNNPEFLLKVFSDNPADKIKKDVDNIVEISIIIFPILSILSKIIRFFKLL